MGKSFDSGHRLPLQDVVKIMGGSRGWRIEPVFSNNGRASSLSRLEARVDQVRVA